MLVPMKLFGLGRMINRFLAPLPVFDALSLRHYAVCRSLQHVDVIRSASVVVPARNECGNIEAASAHSKIYA